MIITNFLVSLFKEIIYLAATASVLVLLLLLLKKIFRRILHPKWHYYIWILLLIRLIVPFEPTSSFSIYSVLYSTGESINLPLETLTNIQADLPEAISQGEISNNTQLADHQAQDGNGENLSGSTIPDTDMADGSVNHTKSGSMIKIAAFFWLSGIIILTVYLFCINIAFSRNIRRRYTPLRDLRIEGILESCKKILGLHHTIPVLTSEKMRTPSLYGLITPCILVSDSYMKQLSDDDIKYIFLHELSHYRRKDIAVNWLLTILQIIYFFNPLIWYAFYKIHEDCEIACDAEVLKYLKEDEYQRYGSTIIKLIRLFSESNFIPATAGISKNKTNYRRRIIMISRFKQSKWTGTLLAVIIIFVVASVGLTGCNAATKTQQESTSPSDTPAEPSPSDPTPVTDDSGNPASQEPSGTSDQKAYYGQWLIKGVLAYDAAGTYSSEDAEKMIGKSLSFSDNEANIINDQPSDSIPSIINPEYEETVIYAEDFLVNFRMTFDKLGITTDSVTEIVVTGSGETAGCTLLLKDDKTIILIAGGTYFELMKP